MKKIYFRFLRAIILLALTIQPITLDRVFADSSVSITAASAIVIDYETGEELYAKNPDVSQVPASMTKIMTAYIIYEELEAGNITLDAQIAISPQTAIMSNDRSLIATVPLESGASYSLDTMLKIILLPSGSAAAVAVAEHISGSEAAFTQRMNETAEKLGMTANFKNCHGAIPHETTARSIATLIRAFIDRFPEVLEITSLRTFEFRGRTLFNTNLLLPNRTFTYQDADGFKTGTLSQSGSNLAATASRNGRRVISVVMGSSSNDNRYTDSHKLLDYGFSEIARRDEVKRTAEFSITVPDEIRLNSDFNVSAILEASSDFKFIGNWQVDGQVVADYDGDIVNDSSNLSFSHYLETSDADGIDIKLVLEMPDKSVREWTKNVPVSKKEPSMYRDINGIWAEPIIVKMSERGLFTGNPEGYFMPNDNVNLGVILTVLGRYAEAADIDDIEDASEQSSYFYKKYFEWALQKDILPKELGEVEPFDEVDRETLATIIHYFTEYYGIVLVQAPSEITFDDESSFSEWALSPIKRLTAVGIMNDYSDNNFRPDIIPTRAEFCTAISVLLDQEQSF